MKNADSEQIKRSTPIGLSFNQLEAVDLSFNLPLRPGLIKPSSHCLLISHQTSCETTYLCYVAG